MGATDREFQAQSGFIAACDDPNTLLDWMREYRDSERAAVGRGDEDEARQMDDLAALAEDRAIELKAALILAARPTPKPPEVRPVQSRSAPVEQPVVPVDDPAAELRKVKAELAASREAQARAERERVAAVARAEQQEREAAAPKFVAPPVAVAPAEIVTAPIPDSRSPEREAHRALVVENERLRLAAARALAASNRSPALPQPMVAPSTPGRRPTPALKPTPIATVVPPAPRQAASAAQAPTAARSISLPSARAPNAPIAPVAELTPLGRLFQQRLTEIAPSPQASPTAPAATRAQPAPVRQPPPPPPPVPVVPVVPADDLPQLTGADLTSYRTWLGVSQRALAIKFAVEQSVISKSERKLTTVLPPQLRKALHEARSEPRQDVGGAR